MLRASDLMTESPATIRPTARLRSALEKLQTLDIRHLPVVDDDGTLVGMISDRDLRALTAPYFLGEEYVGNIRTALDAAVASVMSGDVVSIDAEADIAEVIDLMLDNRIGAVPVINADGLLVGIVSYVDVLRAFPVDADAAE